MSATSSERCPSCGAPVRRSFGKDAVCEYCGSYIPAPKTERESQPKPAATAAQAPAPAPVYTQRRPVYSGPSVRPSREDERRRAAAEEARKRAERRRRGLVVFAVCMALFALWGIAATAAPRSSIGQEPLISVAEGIVFVGLGGLYVALRNR